MQGPGERSCFYEGNLSLGQAQGAYAASERFWALHDRGVASAASDGTWLPVASLPQAVTGAFSRAIWGDAERFFALAGRGLTEGTLADGVTAHHFQEEATDLTAYWVRSPEEAWLGTAGGDLIRFDGASAERFHKIAERHIRRMWGTEDDLYFITDDVVGRFRDGAAEILLSHDPPDLPHTEFVVFTDLHGDAARGELYVSVLDARHTEYECGAVFVLWYDGEVFRRF